MDKKERVEQLQQEWRNKLQVSLWILVGIVGAMEIAVVLLLFFLDKIEVNELFFYFLKEFMIPTLANVIISIGVSNTNHSVNSGQRKNAMFTFGAIGIASVVVIFHGNLAWAVCLYVLPIVASVIFANRRLTWQAFIATIPLMYICQVIAWHLDPTFELVNNLYQGTLNVVFLVAVYMVCKHIISFVEQKNEMIDEQDKNEDNLNHALTLDAMTSLYNHAEFNRVLETRRLECCRENRYMCVVMADIDHFKSVNDTFGHDNGDKVLINVANHLMHFCSDKGQVFRYGGEEFAVIFMDCTVNETMEIMEEMRDALSKCTYDFAPEDRRITISIGIYKYGGETELTTHDIFSRADAALYEAKNSGRNRCVIYKKESAES